MSRIRLNRPEYGLAHLTAETEENKNISIPLIYKQDITGTGMADRGRQGYRLFPQ